MTDNYFGNDLPSRQLAKELSLLCLENKCVLSTIRKNESVFKTRYRHLVARVESQKQAAAIETRQKIINAHGRPRANSLPSDHIEKDGDKIIGREQGRLSDSNRHEPSDKISPKALLLSDACKFATKNERRKSSDGSAKGYAFNRSNSDPIIRLGKLLDPGKSVNTNSDEMSSGTYSKTDLIHNSLTMTSFGELMEKQTRKPRFAESVSDVTIKISRDTESETKQFDNDDETKANFRSGCRPKSSVSEGRRDSKLWGSAKQKVFIDFEDLTTGKLYDALIDSSTKEQDKKADNKSKVLRKKAAFSRASSTGSMTSCKSDATDPDVNGRKLKVKITTFYDLVRVLQEIRRKTDARTEARRAMMDSMESMLKCRYLRIGKSMFHRLEEDTNLDIAIWLAQKDKAI